VNTDNHEGGVRNDVALAGGFGSRLGRAISVATTEHFNLQSARGLAVSEANGRASIYLAALSSSLIALAFVGEISTLGAASYALAIGIGSRASFHHR
jgi:hypothetical protein